MKRVLAAMVMVSAVLVAASNTAVAADTGAVYLVPGFLTDTACENDCAHYVEYEAYISEFGNTGVWVGWAVGVDFNVPFYAGAASLCWFSGWQSPHVEYITPEIALTGAGSACPQGDIPYLTSYLIDPDGGPL